MSEYISVRDAAKQWEVTEPWITRLCRTGRIEGARKIGKSWRIPEDALKPTANYEKEKSSRQKSIYPAQFSRLPLPVGISDFKRAASNYYYVDKTLLIRDFLDEIPQVSLFTRPRRFGKTLNMDMLRTFFEKTEEDTSVYFRNMAIWRCGNQYTRHQGKYPVIFLTFKDAKMPSWEDSLDHIRFLLSNEFQRHGELADSPLCTGQDREYYFRIVSKTASESELMISLLTLSQMLHTHHGTAPIIIIDEYDTLIQQGHSAGFYEPAIRFMRNFFSGGFKDNHHLSYGFLTGILRVAKESIFSGLNNLKINSILDDKYSKYFGFTPDEVRAIADYYDVSAKYPEICEWYDGYRFGISEIFNPWSVINYFSNSCEPRPFWLSTSSNEIIGEVIRNAGAEIYEQLENLVKGGEILTTIDTDVVYPRIRSNPASVYSFLLVAGYLKVTKIDTADNGDYMCLVAIPNKEIFFVYKKEILSMLEPIIPPASAAAIRQALYSGDSQALQAGMQQFLLRSVSSHDAVGELFYHGLILGLCAMLDNRYYITSNREAGDGRYDIQLEPKAADLPGILIELKAEKAGTQQSLQKLASAALKQIDDKQYDIEMVMHGVKTIYKYGVAFHGKKVEIASSQTDTSC